MHLALLPVEPQIGKALVFGCLLGCLDPVLTIAALLSQRNPFVMPMTKKEQADQAKRRFAQVPRSRGGGGGRFPVEFRFSGGVWVAGRGLGSLSEGGLVRSSLPERKHARPLLFHEFRVKFDRRAVIG